MHLQTLNPEPVPSAPAAAQLDLGGTWVLISRGSYCLGVYIWAPSFSQTSIYVAIATSS